MIRILSSDKELKKFFDILPGLSRNEVHFLSLSARNKYLSKEDREYYGLGRTEMFAREIVREHDFSKFLQKVKGYERNEEAYLTKKGMPIPQDCMVCYFNINPTNVLKAYNEFSNTMNEYFMELGLNASKGADINNVSKRINKMDILLKNCFQKNRGTKHFIDIDFDIPKNEVWIIDKFIKNLNENKITYYVIDTKSGYHILLKKDTIQYNFTKVVKEIQDEANDFRLAKMISDKHWEIEINKDEMIPLPGTYQAGHYVRIIDGL